MCGIVRVGDLVLTLRGGDEGRRVDDEDYFLEGVNLIGIRFVGDDVGGRIRSRDCLRGR